MLQETAQPVDFDITNPLHYTVANNHDAVYNLLTVKYKLMPPDSAAETVQAAEYALSVYGEKFAHDMAMIHPDKEALLREAGHFSSCCGNKIHSNLLDDVRTLDQLIAERDRLQNELDNTSYRTPEDRQAVVDELDKIKALILIKQNTKPPQQAGGGITMDKTQQYLLLGLTALGLMWLGSKLFGK